MNFKRLFQGLVPLLLPCAFLSACSSKITMLEQPAKMPSITHSTDITGTSIGKSNTIIHNTLQPWVETKENEVILSEPGEHFLPSSSVERILCYGSDVAQLLLHLGLGEMIAGIDAISDSNLPLAVEVVDFSQVNSLETYDLMISSCPQISHLWAEARFPVVTLSPSNSMDEFYENILFIGELLGQESKSREIVLNMQDDMRKITAMTELFQRKTIYVHLGSFPQGKTVEQNSLWNEVLLLLGLDNVIQEHIPLNQEDLLALNPQVIFFANSQLAEELSPDTRNSLRAFQEEAVFFLNESFSLDITLNYYEVYLNMLHLVHDFSE